MRGKPKPSTRFVFWPFEVTQAVEPAYTLAVSATSNQEWDQSLERDTLEESRPSGTVLLIFPLRMVGDKWEGWIPEFFSHVGSDHTMWCFKRTNLWSQVTIHPSPSLSLSLFVCVCICVCVCVCVCVRACVCLYVYTLCHNISPLIRSHGICNVILKRRICHSQHFISQYPVLSCRVQTTFTGSRNTFVERINNIAFVTATLWLWLAAT